MLARKAVWACSEGVEVLGGNGCIEDWPLARVLLDELKHALVELRSDPASEHRLRDWTDRAALLWAVSLSASKAGGFGTDSDLRAARRVLARHVPTGLLRRDGAGVAELEAIVFA